jgi:hypothetical protein
VVEAFCSIFDRAEDTPSVSPVPKLTHA